MDQRTATRFVSDLEIECHSIGASAPAMLYNVSTDGCMLETPFELPEEWEFLCLNIENLTPIDGHIAWRRGCHAGVRFVRSLDPAVVADLSFDETNGNVRAA